MDEESLYYGRVSSQKQGDTGFSLDAQAKTGQEYANRKGLKIVKSWTVVESAWGKKKKRVSFNQLIEYAKTHPKIKNIIFDIPD